MAMEGLPKVVPPSGRVPGQLLLADPILKWWRRYREEIGKRHLILGVSSASAIYRRRGAARGSTKEPGAPLARPSPRPRHQGAWALVGPLLPYFGDSERLLSTDVLYNFSGIFGAL